MFVDGVDRIIEAGAARIQSPVVRDILLGAMGLLVALINGLLGIVARSRMAKDGNGSLGLALLFGLGWVLARIVANCRKKKPIQRRADIEMATL
jgi:hypothetical protein